MYEEMKGPVEDLKDGNWAI